MKRLQINKPSLLSEQVLRGHFCLPSDIQICSSGHKVPDTQTLQTFRPEICRDPETPPAVSRTPVLRPHNFSPGLGAPSRVRRPPPRRPVDRTLPGGPRSPAAAAASYGRARLAPGLAGRRRQLARGPAPARGERPGAPRFSQTPTWRRPPPPATTTPPGAATAPGPREEAPGKFRVSPPGPSGAGGPPTRASPTPTAAGGGGGGGSEGEGPILLVADAGRGLCPFPAGAFQGVCCPQPRAAGAIQTRWAGWPPAQPLAGDSPAPPVEPDNGCLGWPLPCARTGAPPSTLRARARGHEHTHTPRSPPFLASSLAPPLAPLATRSRGGAFGGGHTHPGRPRAELVHV